MAAIPFLSIHRIPPFKWHDRTFCSSFFAGFLIQSYFTKKTSKHFSVTVWNCSAFRNQAVQHAVAENEELESASVSDLLDAAAQEIEITDERRKTKQRMLKS